MIVRVNVVLNVDSDWHFDNLCDSQSQIELYRISWSY